MLHVKRNFYQTVSSFTSGIQKILKEKWEDEALLVLWKQIGDRLLSQVPTLKNPTGIRLWLSNPSNAHLLSRITFLSMKGCNIKVIPLEINYCSQLQTLYLCDNQISSIPDSINLPHLQSLSLPDNQISSIPDFKNLPHLQTLVLYSNRISSLPDFENVPLLSNIRLLDNRICSIPNFKNLPLLHSLDLSCNQISSIPDFENVPLLHSLDLFGNRVSFIPDFKNVPLLKTLVLSSNQISSIPNFTNLPQLRLLNLSKNRISFFPGFTGLHQLRGINLSGNQISSLPDFTNSPQLQDLYLSNNIFLFISHKDRSRTINANFKIGAYKEFYNAFKNYNCLFSFSSFIKLLGFGVRDKEQIKEAFDQLDKQDQNLLFEMVYLESQVVTDDLQWGEHHVFDDIDLLCKATRKAISEKFDRLTQEHKNRVYGKIYELASPITNNPSWGENHAFGHVLRLIDAIHLTR